MVSASEPKSPRHSWTEEGTNAINAANNRSPLGLPFTGGRGHLARDK